MLWLIGIVVTVVLAHTAPFPFLLDTTDHTLWRMPATAPPTLYLTFDDGPDPATTPQLLDVLGKHDVPATFFVHDRLLTPETLPILRRTFEDGHAVALHSQTRRLMFAGWAVVATTLQEAAARIEVWTGYQTCHAFRPHAGYRSVPMLMGAARAGYTVVGWSWRLSDGNWFRTKTADALVPRFLARASPGDIIAIQDGHHKNPRARRLYAAETLDRVIPTLKARGFAFGTICP